MSIDSPRRGYYLTVGYRQRQRTPQLQTLMQQVGINSFRELYRSTGISAHTINKLRSGNLNTLRWESIVKISDTLQISTSELIGIFGDRQTESKDLSIESLQQEYQQLQEQHQQQRDTLRAEFISVSGIDRSANSIVGCNCDRSGGISSRI
jgi:DNA-binding Xre family transcriptional regulator